MTKSTGRYTITTPDGRRFVVEPILTRDRPRDWSNGGLDKPKGGAIAADESIITEANGFTNIVDLPVGAAPSEYLEKLLRDSN